MAVKVIRKLRLLFDVVFTRPDSSPVQDGDVVTYVAAEDKFYVAEPTGGVGGGAPTNADYLVGTANGSLSAEIVVGTTPGGELGGTWGSPTVDATHSGSSHADVQAAAEATAAAALAAHLAADLVDGDTAGGVLSGTYPNPSFAADMATQAELDAHVNDAADAHDASAISNAPAGGIAATDVQAALDELDSEKATVANTVMDGDAAGGVLSGTYPDPGFAVDMATQAELDAHVNDASDAHDASAISIADAAGDFTATDVEGALAELQTDAETDDAALAAHLADTSDAHDASAISFSPTGSIAATDVQAAIAEVASEAGGPGGSGDTLEYDVTQTGHGLSVGDWVYLNGTDYELAQADDVATAEVVGVVTAVAGVDDFTLTIGGRVVGLTGLTAGVVYFLSASAAGEITATEPSADGEVSKPVLIADSTTSGFFYNMRGIVNGLALP